MHRTWKACLLVILLATAGCAGPHVYIHPTPGLDRIRRMVVMPFDNLAKDDKADEKVRANFVIELLRTGVFNVVDTGEVDRTLQREGLSYSVSQSAIPSVRVSGTEQEAIAPVPVSSKIGDALKAEAILVGAVETYSTERVGDQTIPEVSISARLIDAETGIIIWASAHTRRGSAGIPILGWGKMISLNMLSQQVIQDMVNSLARYTR